MTGMVTASMIERIRVGSDIRATPPSLRMSAGTRSSAITAQAPASWAILACSGVTTSMITPPLSIWASPDLTLNVPLAGGCPLPPLRCAIDEILRGMDLGPSSVRLSRRKMLATALLACGTAASSITGGSSGGSWLPLAIGAVATYAIAAAILGAGLLGLALLVILSRRGGPMPAPVPVGATLSPDGLYWGDGAAWRPVR